MKGKADRIVLFRTTEEARRFMAGLERAVPDTLKPFFKAEMDHGWPYPAVRVWGTSESHITAALLWGKAKVLAIL